MIATLKRALRGAIARAIERRGLLFNLRQLSYLTSHLTDAPAVCSLERVNDPDHLRITWVLPPITAGGGGESTAFRVIRHLAARGHTQRVLVFDWSGSSSLETAQSVLKSSFFDIGAELEMFEWDRDQETDVLIATSWYTAYAVASLTNSAAKLYFVQDLEHQHVAVGTESLLCENTYRFGFPMITAGPWLADVLRREYGGQADFFPLGCDPDEYHLLHAHRERRVACYVRPATPRRAFGLTILALRRFQRSHPDWDVVLYGASNLPAIPELTYQNLGIVKHADLNHLYNTSSIGVVISSTNYSLIPLEMMAAGLPVVDIAGANNISVYGEAADFISLATPTPDGIADAMEALVEPSVAEAQAQHGLEYARDRSWQVSCQQAEAVIRRFALEKAAGRSAQ